MLYSLPLHNFRQRHTILKLFHLSISEPMATTTVCSDSIDVVDFVLNQRNGLKALMDTMAPETIPSQYIQPPDERLDARNILPAGEGKIPVIDVSDWSDPAVAADICEAASKWGFFQIINHGIPTEVLHRIRAAGRAFFDLPVEERKRYWRESSVSKTAILNTSFSPYKEEVLQWRDFLKFHYRPEEDDFAALWPVVCKDQVIDYFKRTTPIMKNILEILMKNLNAEMDETKESALMGCPKMSFTYYPECPNPELAAGSGRHSDVNTLTLLLQDDVGGLYARATEEGDQWIHVTPIEGALVVNIGDILQIMSNDRYRSVEHRVVPNKHRSRFSVPVYSSPRDDALIAPLQEVLKNGEKPHYKEILWSDYLNYFFSKPHDGKKTIEAIMI